MGGSLRKCGISEWFLLLGLVAALGACSPEGTLRGPYPIRDAQAQGCALGSTEPCICTDGTASQRTCAVSGSWSACECVRGCTPVCSGRVCGDDGCGGNCGMCAAQERCEAGVCVPDMVVVQCTPSELGSRLGRAVASGNLSAGASGHTAPCAMSSAQAPEVAFVWTAPSTGRFVFSTEGSTFDTVLTVRDGECDGQALACEDDSVSLQQQSRVSVELRAGQRVTVVIDGLSVDSTGEYSLSISTGCTANCTGRVCGDDGCGATCGSCPEGTTCGAGQCQPTSSSDPCRGVPVGGRCVNGVTIELCVAPTGSATPRPELVTCVSGETCRESAGEARCVTTAVCRNDETRCAGTQLQRCSGGQWVPVVCMGTCRQSALGAQCLPNTSARQYRGVLRYNMRVVRPDFSGWQAAFERVVAQGFLVLSIHDGHVIDSVTTSIGDENTGGRFTVRVAAVPSPDDSLAFVAAQADARGVIQLAVAHRGLDAQNSPELPIGCATLAGSVRQCLTDAATSRYRPSVWSWSMAISRLPVDGGIEILPGYSDAARLFDWGRYIFNRTGQNILGRDGDSLVMWFMPGVKWTCGNCANREQYAFATTAGEPLLFRSQIWISGGPEGTAWAGAVVTHELGHWVMSSYGRNPGEGGPHVAGNPVFPGMAWSEGWATFHNADARMDPFYLSVETSNDASLAFTMWGLNLDNRSYFNNGGARWSRPLAFAGLLQRMDENEVAALLWQLSRVGRGNVSLYNAMADPRASAPNRDGVWERGYRRHLWMLDRTGQIDPTTVSVTREPTPMFADFLDALRCNGFSASDVDRVLVPSAYYPYPSFNPLCRR